MLHLTLELTLATGMHVDMLEDDPLLALATMPVERLEQLGVGRKLTNGFHVSRNFALA